MQRVCKRINYQRGKTSNKTKQQTNAQLSIALLIYIPVKNMNPPNDTSTDWFQEVDTKVI